MVQGGARGAGPCPLLALTSPGAAAAGPGSFDCYVDHPLILRRPTLLNRILTSDQCGRPTAGEPANGRVANALERPRGCCVVRVSYAR